MPIITYEVQQYVARRYGRHWHPVGTYLVDDNEGECRRRASNSMAQWSEDFPGSRFRVVRVEEVEYS